MTPEGCQLSPDSSTGDMPTQSMAEFFVENLIWFCDSADLTLDELLGQMVSHFSNLSRSEVRELLLVDDPVQIQAEISLAKIIDGLPGRMTRLNRWSHSPGRDVDWPRTCLEHRTGRKGEFCNISRRSEPDLPLQQAIVGLASRWRRLLERIGAEGRTSRIDMMRGIEDKLRVSGAPMTLCTLRRLGRIDQKCAKDIELGLRQWEGKGNRGKSLAIQFARWMASSGAVLLKEKNANDLFEWVVTFAIARIAVVREGWEIIPTRLSSKVSYGEILLRRGDWRLWLYKGAPKDGNGNSLTPGKDLVAQIAIQAGYDALEFQPDIVVSLFHNQYRVKTVTTFIADAKHNSVDAKSYFKEPINKAIAYVYGFRPWLPATPRCTLFFWQGVNKIIGKPVASLNGVINPENDRSIGLAILDQSELPEVICFDRRMMGPDSEIFLHWLRRLQRTAERSICELV